jgi:hypothetical protein
VQCTPVLKIKFINIKVFLQYTIYILSKQQKLLQSVKYALAWFLSKDQAWLEKIAWIALYKVAIFSSMRSLLFSTLLAPWNNFYTTFEYGHKLILVQWTLLFKDFVFQDLCSCQCRLLRGCLSPYQCGVWGIWHSPLGERDIH